MNQRIFCFLALSLFFSLYAPVQGFSRNRATAEYTVSLYDTARTRLIPVAVYHNEGVKRKSGVVIFSHGYDRNAGGSYKCYSYLTRSLAAEGYFVISIQHELPGDELLAMEGNFLSTRMPNWQRGAENILFTMKEFQKLRPDLDWQNVSLIGHSNGGDMTMLFASLYPELIRRAVSLDHRRMPMPRTQSPHICSLRGCDYEADPQVLPDADEQKKYGIMVIPLKGIGHSDMDNKGTPAQHREICHLLSRLLRRS